MPSPIVDIHTHVYPPSYLSILRARKTVPYVLDLPEPAPSRLIILPSDDDPSIPPASRGRPIGREYSSIDQKLSFMSTHNISSDVALSVAKTVNDGFEEICKESKGKIYAFAALPLSAPPEDIISEIRRLKTLHHIRGIILGTTGLGSGLDDPKLDPIWSELETSQLLIFLHPHYGLPIEVYGPLSHESGLVLPLSLGFPMETTIAFVRMWISGVFDRYTRLKVLTAHAGGTLPFLAGRVESCVEHERRLRDESGKQKDRRSILDVLNNNVWLDAVTYSEIGTKASIETVGIDRVLFGTDHPFFPPLDEGAKEWVSVKTNITAVEGALGTDNQAIAAVLGGNAINLLKLDIPDTS